MAAEVSISGINEYLRCPRYAYLNRHLPRQTDYPRLAGIAIHQHIQLMEKPVREVNWCPSCSRGVTAKQAALGSCRRCQSAVEVKRRRFYYETPEKMVKSWNYRWAESLTEATQNGWLVKVDKDVAVRYFGIGRLCLTNYWKAFAELPRPKLVEKRYSYLMPSGTRLTGVLDQIREVTLERIVQVRPELMVDGRLREGFDPMVVVDCKSGFFTYDMDGYLKEISPTADPPTDKQRALWQYSLHEDIQPTAYLWLYSQAHQGRQPVWFEWCHLRSGSKFVTWRDQRDFQEFNMSVKAVINGIQAEDFPKRVDSYACRRCDRVAPCRGERPFYYISPEPLAAGFIGAPSLPPLTIETRPTNVVISPVKQLRLRVTVPRVKQDPPPLIRYDQVELPPQPRYVVKNPPWEDLPEGSDMA